MLTSETDVLRVLQTGSYTLDWIYAQVAERADITRAGGLDPVPGHDGDLVWKHRTRCGLQTMQRVGLAAHLGWTKWAIQGTPQAPTRLMLVVAGGTPLEFEIRLGEAIDLLTHLDRPADLVLCDPPWGLHRGRGHFADGSGYRRDHRKVLPGYVDVEPDHYAQFTRDWILAAAAALRPGGQLVVVTGPQRAGIVQVTAEQLGLTWIASIAAVKDFPLKTERKPAASHWVITVMCNGPEDHALRVYHPPFDQPRARSGHPYPRDVWYDNGRADRRGDLIRYDNALPGKMTARILHCFSNEGDHVVDPMCGGGETIVQAWRMNRRITAGDANQWGVWFSGARLLDEHAWPADQQPGLIASPAEQMAAQARGLW
jgi:DNA modification methylase